MVNLLDQFTAGRIVSTISIGGTNIANKVKSDHNHDGYFKSGSVVIVMLKYTLAALLVTPGVCQCATISLCGDVQPNPGPLQSLENNLNAHFNLKPRGLRIGQWNVNHLNDSKLEEIKLALIGVDYSKTRLEYFSYKRNILGRYNFITTFIDSRIQLISKRPSW